MRAVFLSLKHAVAAAVFIVLPAQAAAQVGLPALPSANPGSILNSGVRLEGLFYTAPVTVDGAPIFRVAVRLNDPAAEPINVRTQFIQSAIGQILETRENGATIYDPKTLRVEKRSQGNQAYLVAYDARKAPQVPILTITVADSDYNHSPRALLAAQWQQTLQAALTQALVRRQPAMLKQNYNTLGRVSVGLLLATALLWVLIALLRRRAKRYDERARKHQETLEDEGSDATVSPPDRRRRFLALALRAAGPAERARQVRTASWLLGWIIVLAWFATIIWALDLFPQTAVVAQTLVRTVTTVLAIWIGAVIVKYMADLLIGRFATAYGRSQGNSEERARQMLRAPTISHALGGATGFLVTFVAALWTLSVIGIPVTSVITIGGVLALAISFAAQNLVRDFLNGFLVLAEDQYVVGDYIMIGDYNGIVEAFTLRMVRLRDSRGNVVIIPHSSVTQVVNASRDWARVDYRVAIDPAADVVKAIATLRATMQSMSSDSAWRSQVLDAVEIIGVELISKNGIVLRATMRTGPLRQFELYRALNARVLDAFARQGIALGVDPLPPLPQPPHASPDPL